MHFSTNSSFQSNFPARAAVIIDGGYWRQILKSHNLSKVDLVALSDTLSLPAYRLRSYFFDGRAQENQSFHDSLQFLDRFEVYLGEIAPKTVYCKTCQTTITVQEQKRVDVALAVEIVHLATAGHVDLIVLIAGDRDFIPAIETAKHAGVIIRLVYGSPETVSDSLLKLVDEKIELSREYLNQHDIRFEKPIRPTKPILASSDPERLKTEVLVVQAQIEDILLQLLSQTSEDYVHLSQIGIELMKRIPNWKEKTKVKDLLKLVQMDELRFFLKKQNNHYLITARKGIPRQTPSKTTTLETFISNIIKEYLQQTKKDSISITRLGTLLHQKDPEWKKKYGVNQLKTALTDLQDILSVSGKSPKMQVKLR